MAYPFAQMPTLDEFVQRVSADYQVRKETTTAVLRGPRGQTRITYLHRDVDGQLLAVPLPDIPLQQRLMPSVLRCLCDALQIPPAEFGLTLADIDALFDQDPDDD